MNSEQCKIVRLVRTFIFLPNSLQNRLRFCFILVVGIIIAAGALFTAVYDVIYKYNSSNTINLNAATMDYTGQDGFLRDGKAGETTTLSFNDGTWMVVFWGESKYYSDTNTFGGTCATCIAFYKGKTMSVSTSIDGGYGAYANGGGKTVVQTNFALPGTYTGLHDAMAGGAGAGNVYHPSLNWMKDSPYYLSDAQIEGIERRCDAVFAGYEIDTWGKTCDAIAAGSGFLSGGMPATQTRNGYRGSGSDIATTNNNYYSNGVGGGAGWYNGGASDSVGNAVAGGGSCTPWCYPLYAGDIQRGKEPGYNWKGGVFFRRLDPSGKLDDVVKEYGEEAVLVNSMTTVYTPTTALQQTNSIMTNYDCGIRAGWVYSASEDGKSWHGVGPDDKLSASETQASDTQ